MFEPVPVSMNHSENAVDGTKIIMDVIKAQFFISASGCAFLLVLMLMLVIALCSKTENADDESMAIWMEMGCLFCAGIVFFIVFILGSVVTDIWMNIVRYKQVVRVCSGDFLVGQSIK